MRIWDVSPGYLSRQRLLGEHRELHGLYNVVTQHKTGYAHHPETRRWVGAVRGLIVRHALLAAEMRLRGYTDRTPLVRRGPVSWPTTFVTQPADQFELLRRKYAGTSEGRIPLPRNAQQIWAQHKYSVMARDPNEYRRIGRAVARMRRGARLDALAMDLTLLLRESASPGRVVNAIEHMWGHVARSATPDERREFRRGPSANFAIVQGIAMRVREPFLVSSTALGELGAFVSR